MLRTPRPLTSACAAAVLALAIAPVAAAPAFADASDGTLKVVVELDVNANGIRDGDDTPQSGIKITVTDVSGQSREGVTDDSGEFVVKGTDDLTGGRFFVVADIPKGLVPVPAGNGYEPLNTTVDVTTADQTLYLGVAEQVESPTPAAPDSPPPSTAPTQAPAPPAATTEPAPAPDDPAAPSFAVGGYVWQDVARQGTQDGSDPPATKTSVQLLDADGKVVATTATVGGHYRFEGVPAGVYAVRFSGIQPGFRFSPTGVGPATRDSDPDNTGVTPAFTLDVGAPNVHETAGGEYLDSTIDAGIAPLRYAVGAQVWQDTSGDGILQAGEPPGQARVTLLDARTGAEVATTTTDPTGRYLFDDVAGGTYRLHFDDLGDNRQLTSAHVGSNPAVDSDPDPRSGTTAIFTLGQSSTELVPAREFGPVDADFVDATLNAGVVGSYMITNRVWNDVNGDGLLSPGESGIKDVLVQVLDAAKDVVASTRTDSTGRYTFTALPAGQYQLKFSRRDGLHFTATGVGGDRAADSDVYVDGLTAPITVGEGHPVENGVAAGLTASATRATSAAPTTAPTAAAAVTSQPTLSGTGGVPAAILVGGGLLLFAGGALVVVARRRHRRV